MRRILFIALMLGVDCALWAQSSLLHNGQQETARERVSARLTTEGGLSSITIDGDTTRMNWTVEPTGQQYPWIGPQYQWGLGTLRVDGQPADWHVADRVEWTKDGSSVAEFTVAAVLRSLSAAKSMVKTSLNPTHSGTLAASLFLSPK